MTALAKACQAPLRVGIIGAAIAGPVLALQMLSHPVLKLRYETTLYDQAPEPTDKVNQSDDSQQASAGAAVALFGNGLYPLFQLGLRDALQNAGRETADASFWHVGYQHEHKHIGTMSDTGWADDVQSHVSAIERRHLQSILLKRCIELGGSVDWGKKLDNVAILPNDQVQITFRDSSSDVVDLLVGADGAFSKVRKHVLTKRNPVTAEQRWLPDIFGASGIYGISSGFHENKSDDSMQTHALWLDRGNLSTSRLPGGKMRWDLQIPEQEAYRGQWSQPQQNCNATDDSPHAEWQARIQAGTYPTSYTAGVLQKHFDVYHPTSGSFGNHIEASERIIHTPLRQRVWPEDEIQCGNVVLIGDASRTLLPSSGQGTGFAIEDATVLASCLLRHAQSLNPGNAKKPLEVALQEYARKRVPRSRRMAQVAWYAGKLGLGETWYWRLLRDLSSRLAGAGGPGQASGWPFSDRFDVDAVSRQ